MTMIDSLTGNLWRLPMLCLAIALIVVGALKQKSFPRVGQRVLVAGVIELSVTLLSWVGWELFIRNLDYSRWGYGLFNMLMTVIGLAGYIVLLSAVFLDRPQVQAGGAAFDPRFIDPRLMGQQMNPQQMYPQPGATQWPGQPPQ
jgi:hypothetical protein